MKNFTKLTLGIIAVTAITGASVMAMSSQVKADSDAHSSSRYGKVTNIETNPITGVSEALQLQSSDIYEGRIDAPVQIVEYASMTCGHCANFYNDSFIKLKEHYIATGKVRFVFRMLPWDNLALAVSKVATCAPREQYDAFIGVFMQTQESWLQSSSPLAEIKKVARLGGMTPEKVEECINNKELHEQIAEVKDIAFSRLNVKSTPTFFINGEKIEGAIPFEVLAKAIEKNL